MKALYLEERIALVRYALNAHSLKFEEALPVEMRSQFKQYVHDMMTALEGDPFEVAVDRLRAKS